jgi:hypothetical protein
LSAYGLELAKDNVYLEPPIVAEKSKQLALEF